VAGNKLLAHEQIASIKRGNANYRVLFASSSLDGSGLRKKVRRGYHRPYPDTVLIAVRLRLSWPPWPGMTKPQRRCRRLALLMPMGTSWAVTG